MNRCLACDGAAITACPYCKPAELPETSKCLPESGKPAAPFIPAPKELKDAAKELLTTTKISNKPATPPREWWIAGRSDGSQSAHRLPADYSGYSGAVLVIEKSAYDELLKNYNEVYEQVKNNHVAFCKEKEQLREQVAASKERDRYKAALERICTDTLREGERHKIAREALRGE